MRENFEDPEAIIRSRNSKNDRQYNDQKKRDKRTSNGLKKTKREIITRATRTPLKTGWLTQVLRKGNHICSY